MNAHTDRFYAHGEANFGSIWGQAEDEAAKRAMWRVVHGVNYERVEQERYEAAAARVLGPGHWVSVNSCGTALDITLDFLDVGPGDEVISCPLNFFGVHTAVIRRGAQLVLADSAEGEINLDAMDAATKVTRRTKVIIVTHMNGMPADTVALRGHLAEAARRLSIPVPHIVEDAARSMGASLEPDPSSVIRLYSTHRKKILSTLGEGGLIQTSDNDLYARALEARSYGLGRAFGSSLRLTEPQAAAGTVQLDRLAAIRLARRALVTSRERQWHLDGTASDIETVRAPGDIPYMHTVLLSDRLARVRDTFAQRLASRGIGVKECGLTHRTHDVVGRHASRVDTPRAEQFSRRAICLPLHPSMQVDDERWFQSAVAQAARESLRP